MSEVPTTVGTGVGNGRPPVERRFGQPNGNIPTHAGMPKGTKQVKKRLNNALRRYIRDHPGCEYEIAGALVEEARTRPETVIEGEGEERTVRHVGSGWTAAQKLIWDRRDGLLTQKHEHDIRATMVRVVIKGTTAPPEMMP